MTEESKKKKKDKVLKAIQKTTYVMMVVDWFNSTIGVLRKISPRRFVRYLMRSNIIGLAVGRVFGMLYYALNIPAVFRDPDLSKREKTLQIAGSLLMLGLIGIILFGPLGGPAVIAVTVVAGAILNSIYSFKFFHGLIDSVRKKVFPDKESKTRAVRLATAVTYALSLTFTLIVSFIPAAAQIIWPIVTIYAAIGSIWSAGKQIYDKFKQKKLDTDLDSEAEANAQGYQQVKEINRDRIDNILSPDKTIIIEREKAEDSIEQDAEEKPEVPKHPGQTKK